MTPRIVSKSSIVDPSNVKVLTVTELTPVTFPPSIVNVPFVNVPSIVKS